MNKDLTTGKPEKVLWQFCLPLFGSIIFQQLYNIADSFVAGKFISDNALAAVGNSYEITLIFIAFAFGCNIACSVLAALFFGAKQYNDLKTDGLYGAHFQLRDLRGVDARGHALLRQLASAHQNAGRGLRGLEIIPRHLHLRSAVRVPLQCRNRHFLSAGRLQNAVYLSCLLVHV